MTVLVQVRYTCSHECHFYELGKCVDDVAAPSEVVNVRCNLLLQEDTEMALSILTRALRLLTVSQPALLSSQVTVHCLSVSHITVLMINHKHQTSPVRILLCQQVTAQSNLGAQVPSLVSHCRGFLTTAPLEQNKTFWKHREKYTIRPIGKKKTGGRDYTGMECDRTGWMIDVLINKLLKQSISLSTYSD